MSGIVWALGFAFFFLACAYAGWLRWRLRAALVRVGLVESRERDVLEAVRRLCAACRESAQEVLVQLEQAVLRASPGTDAVLFFEADGEELAAVHAGGPRAGYFGTARLRLDGPANPLTQAVLCGHRAFLGAGLAPLLPTDTAALAVPLPPGFVMYVSSAGTRVVENAETVVRLAEQARAPLAIARERETDRVKATYDGLTGLLTARAFRTALAEDVLHARITGSTVCVLFVDTDHFKDVNDTHGHAAGDIVLQAMARILSAHATPGVDRTGRNGGDEFCAVLLNTTKRSAILRAQAVLDAVSAHDFGAGIHIGASIGVAAFPADADSANEVLEVADAAMYHSKHSGRNCVSFRTEGQRFERYVP